jgi:hypothetical protein
MNWRYVPKGTLGEAMLGERKTNQAVMKALAGAISMPTAWLTLSVRWCPTTS